MNKDTTPGEKYDPIFKVKTKEEAQEYFEMCVGHTLAVLTAEDLGSTREFAEKIERENIAYWAGYGSHEDRLRIEELFKCVHPIFGPAVDGPPTPEEAFKLGQEMGRAHKEKTS